MNSANTHIISIYRDGNFLLATTTSETYPLSIIELLHRIYTIFEEYFLPKSMDEVSYPLDETIIKENFSVVYSLLEEILDFGTPLTTELNALTEIIAKPSILSKVNSALVNTTGLQLTPNTNKTSIYHNPITTNTYISNNSVITLPDGTINNMPWRRNNVFYNTNEIYFDITESLELVLDDRSGIVSSDVCGVIMCNAKLSGMV